MTDAGRHPNITLLTMSEVKEITGFVGNFHVRILKRARYVKEKECTACGDCVEVCPVGALVDKQFRYRPVSEWDASRNAKSTASTST